MERRWWTLIGVCGATFMLLVDVTIVQVALPAMQRNLHASFADLQWVISAYALTLAALILTAGSLADRFGRKRVFAAGVAVFSVASLSCGLAGNAATLIGSRAAQGIGGAAMFATSLALIGQEFHSRDMTRAVAIWGATVGGAVAIGPLVGGALTDAFGWKWIFLVNVPIGMLTLLLAATKMVNRGDPGAIRADWAGLVTFSASLFCLVLGLIRGNDDGWSSARIVGLLTGAAVLMGAFVVAEARRERPMFDLALFRNPAFTGVSVATLMIGAGMFAMFPYLTLYLQNYLGLSPLGGGLRMLPATLLTFGVPIASRRALERVPPGLALGAGLAITGTGILAMTVVRIGSTWTALLPGLVLIGIGIGLANPVIARLALAVVPPQSSGTASGINNTFRIGGLATGVAVLGALLQARIAGSLASSLGHGAPGLARELATTGTRQLAMSAAAGAPGGTAALHAGQVAFIAAMHRVMLAGGLFVLAGCVATAAIRARHFPAARVGTPEPARSYTPSGAPHAAWKEPTMRISEILARKGDSVATIPGSATVADAVAELGRQGIGALVVSADGRHIDGILSERDVVRTLDRKGPAVMDLPVRSLMSTHVTTCNPGDEAEMLMAIMTEKRIRHVPVAVHGVLSGIVSIGDVVKARIDELEKDRKELYAYITAR